MPDQASVNTSKPAIRADDLFRRPDLGGYRALLEAAEEAGVREAVRTAVLRALETVEPPGSGERVAYAASLHAQHRRKRRFIEVLDGVSGRPIVQG